jgi:hypothetical protein
MTSARILEFTSQPSRAANSKDEYFSAESLFMVLILQQQATIKESIGKVSVGRRQK